MVNIYKILGLCVLCLLGPRILLGQQNDSLLVKNSDGKFLKAEVNGTNYLLLKTNCPSFSVKHVAGDIAPQTVTITYQSAEVENSSDTLCWLTQNLGASIQADSVIETDNAALGWAWQYNRKQGWTYDFSTSTTYPEGEDFPTSAYYGSVNWTSANDPCTNLLGDSWRLPTESEWSHVISGWSDWNDAFSSVLKLSTSYSFYSDETPSIRTERIAYWSRSYRNSSYSYYVVITESSAKTDSYYSRRNAFPVRCVREYPE